MRYQTVWYVADQAAQWAGLQSHITLVALMSSVVRPAIIREAGNEIWARVPTKVPAVGFLGEQPGVVRRQDTGARTTRKPVRPKSVTHVSGTNCYLCLRAGPSIKWRAQGDDLRTFLSEFVSILPQVEVPIELHL